MSEIESLASLFQGTGNNTSNGTKSASSVIDGLVVAGAGDDVQQEVQDGISESQQAMKALLQNIEGGASEASNDAQAAEQAWEEEFWDVCSSAKTLGKAVGVEIGKGALFCMGTQLVLDALMGEIQSGDDSRVKMMQAVQEAIQVLQNALDTWARWQACHYDSRESYGTMSLAPGVPIDVFERIQNHISGFGEQRDRLSQLAYAARETQDLDDVQSLVMATMAYAQAVYEVSGEIVRHTALTDGGLPPQQQEIQAVYMELSKVSA